LFQSRYLITFFVKIISENFLEEGGRMKGSDISNEPFPRNIFIILKIDANCQFDSGVRTRFNYFEYWANIRLTNSGDVEFITTEI
jgi:hypothetical protein